VITTTTTITKTTTGAETTDIMIENDKEDDTTTLTAIIKQRIKQRMEQLKYTHSNLFTDQIMMFSDILFYTLCYRSIEKASKEEYLFASI
jgi:uncharacterized membrane protein YcaP (DUF421 family)